MSNQQKILNYSGRGAKIKLRGKKLKDGSISLYLDYYTGYKKDIDGKIKTNRKIEYINSLSFTTHRPHLTEQGIKNT